MKINNPVLKGFHPDPSIVRAGEDYYIAVSSCVWYPGIAIFRSHNLSDWRYVTSVLNDERFMDLRGVDFSCGIWAPNLTYHDGMFYLIYTIVYTDRPRFKDTHNYLITAERVEGPWSDPVYLNCSGFDPSLFHEDDKKWLVNMRLDHRTDHPRFSGVDMQEYDPKEKKLIGPVYHIFDGSPIGKTEAPNIIRHGDYYYLTCAEGGTEEGHCVTVARAKCLQGPYEIDPENPIMTSRTEKTYPIQRAGHGQLVEGASGHWYMAHLCSRPVEGFSIIGRETSLQNMVWTQDGWVRLAQGGKLPADSFVSYETENADEATDIPKRRCFDNGELPPEFMTLREPAARCGVDFDARPGWLRLHGGYSLSSRYHQALVVRRQQAACCRATAYVSFEPADFHHMAGLICYYNQDNYHYLHISRDDIGNRCISVTTLFNGEITQTERCPLPESGDIELQADINGVDLCFQYRVKGNEAWQIAAEHLDMRILSDERVLGNGFTGAMIGICCQDLQGNGTHADFSWFEYEEATP